MNFVLHLHCVFLRLHLSGQAEEVALPDVGQNVHGFGSYAFLEHSVADFGQFFKTILSRVEHSEEDMFCYELTLANINL